MAAKKKQAPAAAPPPPVHTAATATMLAFANPPMAEDAGTVANECATAGFAAVGVVINGPSDVVDFGRFDTQSCVDLANSIEMCVDGKGYELPPLAGTFDVMREHGTQITLGNFVKALTAMMKPKS